MTMVTTYANVTSTAATRLGGKLPTSTDIFCMFPGVDLNTSRNLTPGGASVVVKGTGPTYTSQYAQFDPANAFTVGAMGAASHTLMMVFRRVLSGSGAATRMVYTAPSGSIAWDINPTTGLMTLDGVITGTTTPATLTIAGDLDEWRFVAATIGVGTTKIYNRTDNTASSDGGSGAVSGNASNSLEICGGPSGSNTRPIQCAFFARTHSILTQGQIDEYYDWAAPQLRRFRGITC